MKFLVWTFCLLFVLIRSSGTVVIRHGRSSGLSNIGRGYLFASNRSAGESRSGHPAPQLKWDPDKDLIMLGEDVVSDNVAGQKHQSEIVTNFTVQQGLTAFLPCRVRHLADKKVTWIRRRDYHILTSGVQTLAMDGRFSVVRGDSDDDWSLQIKFVQERDHGVYECQVPTKTGRYVYRVFLNVSVPKASILGSKELHVQSGSTISLQCVIDGTVRPSSFVFWYHNENMINYDRQRGGITVQTEHQPRTSSKLTIMNASYTDSGNYTCSASDTNSTVYVYVSEGDKTAAIQRLGSGGSQINVSFIVAFLSLLSFFHESISTVLEHT